MASELISRCIIIVFGLLYPAYCSYKAIKSRSSSQYVKWMMYWIVFALFYNVETIADLLISWFPMYYEMKAIFVIWLLSPLTQGSQVLYKMYIHPRLVKHEQEIEETLEKVKKQGYSTFLNVGAQGMNMALQGAIAGQTRLADQLRKSYSFDSTDSSHSMPQFMDDGDIIDGEDTYDPLRSRYDSRHRQLTYRNADMQRREYLRGQLKSSTQNYRSLGMTESMPPLGGETGKKLPLMRNSQSSPGLSQQGRRPVSYPEHNNRGPRIVTPVTRRPRSLSDKQSVEWAQRIPSSTLTKHSTHRRPVEKAEVSRSLSPRIKPKSPAVEEATPIKTQKPRFSESTLRYRTKKISDIKSNNIESPFISIF